jgi:hypothetical protein
VLVRHVLAKTAAIHREEEERSKESFASKEDESLAK